MFKQELDLFLPDFYIDCARLNAAKDIYEIFRAHDYVEYYAYVLATRISAFEFKMIKIGRSTPCLSETSSSYGERLVRQIAFLKGWDKEPTSDHGEDLIIGINQAIEDGRLKPEFSRYDLTIGVWDIGKRETKFYLSNIDNATSWAEGKLADLYFNKYGCLPLLNKVDPRNQSGYKKSYVSKEECDRIFNFS